MLSQPPTKVIFVLLLATTAFPPFLISTRGQELPTRPQPSAGAELERMCPDVPATHWAYPALKNIYDAGIVEGQWGGAFGGDKPITRAEFVVAMARFSKVFPTFLAIPMLTERDMNRTGAGAFEPPATGGKEYIDVPRSHWAYFALRRMSAAGVIRGLTKGTLGANAPLNRYDFAVALERIVAFINNDSYYFEQLQNPQAADPTWESTKPFPFKDVPRNHRAYRAIARLWSVGVFQGDEGASFRGTKPLTRYEFAAAVSRLWDLRGPYLD